MVFSDAYTALLQYAGRTATDALSLAVAQQEINAACLWANRNKNFKYNEGYSTITYPANQQLIVPSNVCNASILNIISAELCQQTTDTSGVPLRIMEYQNLQKRRRNYDDLHRPLLPQWGYPALDYIYLLDFQQIIQDTERYIICTIGNGFTMYPIPTQDTILLILFNKQLPALSADSDTNFFLENIWDFILMRALSRFNIYLKDDSRMQITSDELAKEWRSVVAWDSSVRADGGRAS